MANWDDITNVGNVEDRRGMSGGLALTGIGGAIALLITLGLNYMGMNISPETVQSMLNSVEQIQGQAPQTDQPAEFRSEDSYEVFAQKVLGSTDTVWAAIFGENGLTYQNPKLVLFRDATQSGCGVATSAIGPHYCPADNTIYLDETFFDELRNRYGANTGEVAQGYVIAHEVGHGVQNQLGVFDNAAAGQLSNSDSIATELQADCYAGIWAFAQARNGVLVGDEATQAMEAAAAVGDDRIQEATEGRVDRESWTHGSSTQRASAFKTGYDTGQPSRCVDLQ